MLRALIAFCVRQPILTVLGAVVVAAIGGYCAMVVPIDAIPNVGENQVIVFTEWPGRSPKDVEDQVTYPLSVALLTVPHAESVRGKSMFGYSFVQITFADGHRVLLGALAGTGAFGDSHCIASRGSDADAGPRRHGIRADLLLRDRRPAGDEPRRAAHASGLRRQVRTSIGAGCQRSRQHRWLCAAVPDRGQPRRVAISRYTIGTADRGREGLEH